MPPALAYFRYEAQGLENIPKEPTLLVGNHSGGKVPIDMFLFAHAWYSHVGFERPLYALMHDLLFAPAPLRRALLQLGGVPAKPKNASFLLEQGQSVIVLPGGEHETFRPFRERYVIDFGQRAGFAETALRHRVPVTPVVTIGSHELFFILSRGKRVAKALRFDKFFRASSFPIVFGFPFGLYLGPLPTPVPLPSKILTSVLPPIYLHREEHDHRAFHGGDLHYGAARQEMQRVVVTRMQAELTRLAKLRQFPVLG